MEYNIANLLSAFSRPTRYWTKNFRVPTHDSENWEPLHKLVCKFKRDALLQKEM